MNNLLTGQRKFKKLDHDLISKRETKTLEKAYKLTVEEYEKIRPSILYDNQQLQS